MKMRNFMVVMVVMMVLVVALSDKIATKRDMVLGKILNNEVETVEVEAEETKELDGVIVFTKNGKFLVYQIIYTDGSFETALDLAMLVNSLNERTNKVYVQTGTGKVQEIDTESKKIVDIKMAHAETKDLW